MIWPSVKTHWFLNLIPPGYKVSTKYDLPTGYALAYVPPNAIVQPTSSRDENDSSHWKSEEIVSSNSLVSPLIAILQIFYASATLYQSRGYQIARYGYAAFGFTVLPYLVMSFINLLGRVLTPTYPDLYLVRTEIMDEAIHRGGRFDNIVGSLLSDPLPVKDLFVFSGVFKNQYQGLWEFQPSSKVYKSGEIEPSTNERLRSAQTQDTIHPVAKGGIHPPSKLLHKDTHKSSASSQNEDDEDENVLICPRCYNFKVSEIKELPRLFKGRKIRLSYILFSISLLVIITMPLLVIGVMSRFQPGESTIAQRVWILGWLLVGMVAINNPFCVDLIIIGIDNVKSRLTRRRHLQTHESGPSDRERRHYRQGIKIYASLVLWICMYLGFLATPAIGRFVVVGQMLHEYGSCLSLE
ncbi:hypothetical protein N7509_002876 [Penicillium cosmopolitanum]|uniref:Uncharacterized protein n=1 Tax=Penicillium cosmopolitanum TaxID=1131564 RepID=A0A9W9W9W1_9EURO|nr:uncharacterized protein N7509_002876 [Penicillium cosmopolitanum]KAJ5408993.1 hypothetical protein N7509_002876 [Penicillium cosmopolitanum]